MEPKKYSILYAEDNPEVQVEVVEYLQKYFKEVYVANDGKEALKLYSERKVDSLLLDIDMPFVNGLTVAKEVRVLDKTIPIVMLTAFTDTDKLLCATELHLCKYLVKPIDLMGFRNMIKKLLVEIDELQSDRLEISSNYVWNSDSKKLYHNNQLISLSQKEQVLLGLLIEKRSECVTFTEIMALVWEDDFDAEVSIQSVKFQVTLLRKKLPKNSIQNVYGKGYIFS
ncbi:MAG TPA: response regulator transcription factor [Campylobacterales bacterium]|nr:response regulator transcription factor [Campylobacterales bacterium]